MPFQTIVLVVGANDVGRTRKDVGPFRYSDVVRYTEKLETPTTTTTKKPTTPTTTMKNSATTATKKKKPATPTPTTAKKPATPPPINVICNVIDCILLLWHVFTFLICAYIHLKHTRKC